MILSKHRNLFCSLSRSLTHPSLCSHQISIARTEIFPIKKCVTYLTKTDFTALTFSLDSVNQRGFATQQKKSKQENDSVINSGDWPNNVNQSDGTSQNPKLKKSKSKTTSAGSLDVHSSDGRTSDKDSIQGQVGKTSLVDDITAKRGGKSEKNDEDRRDGVATRGNVQPTLDMSLEELVEIGSLTPEHYDYLMKVQNMLERNYVVLADRKKLFEGKKVPAIRGRRSNYAKAIEEEVQKMKLSEPGPRKTSSGRVSKEKKQQKKKKVKSK